jgi:predicted PurR-regulated permease PerM
LLGGLILLLSSQISRVVDAWPRLIVKFEALFVNSTCWVSEYFGVKENKVNDWVSQLQTDVLNDSNLIIGRTISSMGGVIAVLTITPVYVFMILFYQPHLVEFTHRLFGTTDDSIVNEITIIIEGIIKNYLVGLFFEFIIIAILNSIGLLVLDLHYAILLGIIGALLNVIPYIGGVIAVLLYILVALLTKSPIFVVYVTVLYSIIQFVDNHFIVPLVVGAKVQINALVSIIVVLAGAALWGIPGMFLSIPITAIIKLIFDRIESLKPWGFLLGEVVEVSQPLIPATGLKGFLQKIMHKNDQR